MNKFIVLLVALVIASCQPSKKQAKSEKSYSLKEVWKTPELFKMTESVIYDEELELLYVSSIDRHAQDENKAGMVSRLGLDGKVLSLDWIKGLRDPHGLAVRGNSLFVTDVNQLFEFDKNSGEILKSYDFKGGRMLFDICVGKDNNLYITDRDANKIYMVEGDEVKIFKENGLDKPNGIHLDHEFILVASSGSKDVVHYKLSDHSKEVIATNVNRGDGIVPAHEEGYYFVSDWYGRLLMINPNHELIELINTDGIIKIADIEYIKDKNLLLVPTYDDHKVVAYQLITQ